MVALGFSEPLCEVGKPLLGLLEVLLELAQLGGFLAAKLFEEARERVGGRVGRLLLLLGELEGRRQLVELAFLSFIGMPIASGNALSCAFSSSIAPADLDERNLAR